MSRLAALGAFVLVLGGCDDATPLERGTRIFQRTCSPCHGRDGRKGEAALGFNPPPRDLTQRDFQLSRSDEELRRSIRLGKGQMPAFGGILSDSDITGLIVFIRSLGPPELRPASTAVPSGGLPGVGGAEPTSAATSETSATPAP